MPCHTLTPEAMLNSTGYVDQIQQAGSFRVNFSTLLVEDWTWPIEWEAYHNVYISTLDMVGIVGNRVLQQHGGDLPGIEANLRPFLGPPICSISSPLFALCQVASPSGRGWRSPHSALRTARAIDRRREHMARIGEVATHKSSDVDHVPKKTLTQTLL